MVGRIELIIGPMFAGKTTELMRRVKREIHARRTCFIIKYAKDTRYSNECVSSHDRSTLRATFAASALKDVGSSWQSYDVVAIDEGQFFGDIIEFSRKCADAGKTVIVSALDGDFQRKPFGKICEMIPMCETISKLTAVCMMCHEREGSFTRRTVSGDEQELIGGAEMYIATCRPCYNNPIPPTPKRMHKVREAIAEVEHATMAAVSRTASPVEQPPVGGAAMALPFSPLKAINQNNEECSKYLSGKKSIASHAESAIDGESAAKKLRVE